MRKASPEELVTMTIFQGSHVWGQLLNHIRTQLLINYEWIKNDKSFISSDWKSLPQVDGTSNIHVSLLLKNYNWCNFCV